MAVDKSTLDALRIDRDPPRRGPGPAVVFAVLLLLALGAAAAWWWTRSRPIVVRTVLARAAAANAADRVLLNASGYVTARREATVSSKVTGKVVEVLVEEGMNVAAGQVLARLDDANVQTSLKLAEAQLEAARRALDETRPALEQARREQRRVAQLVAARTATQLELDRADTEVLTLEARLQRLEAQHVVAQRELGVWQQQLDDTVIRAPFAGVVTSKNAQPGEMISPISAGGGYTRTGICTVVDMGSLEVEVDVSESYINRVHAGQPAVATLDSYPNWEVPARVIAIIPTADRQKATVKVRVALEQLDSRVLPDMSVKVAFRDDTPPLANAQATIAGVLAPRAVLDERGGRPAVWVVDDGKAERRAVSVGDRLAQDVALTAGVAAGERLVLDPPSELTDGQAVREARQ